MDQQNKLLQFIFNHPLLALFFFFQAILLILFTVTIIRTSTNNNSTGNLVTNEGVYNQDAIPQVKIPDLKTLYLPDDGITNIQRALASTMAHNNESYEKANEMMREAIYNLKRQAISETKPEMNSYIRKIRARMKANLAEISKEIEEARNAKAGGK